MELLPKKATEKIGEAIRKKLPKKSVAFSGSENGLFKKGGRPATDRMAVRGDSDPARLSRTTVGTLSIRQILCVVDLRKYVTFWRLGGYPIEKLLPIILQILSG